MNEKDMQNLMELAESQLRKTYTAEDALGTFMRAGILDANGNFTPPYQAMLDGVDLD